MTRVKHVRQGTWALWAQASVKSLNKNNQMIKRGAFSVSLFLLTWVLTSCASMVVGSVGMNRDITILSEPSGATIYVNDIPRGTTPTKLQLSSRELTRKNVMLVKKGYKTTSIKAADGVDGMIAGNILFGGVGGAVVDGISGNATATKRVIQVRLEPDD